MRPFEGEHDGSSIPCARAGVKPAFGSGRAIFENRPASFCGEAARSRARAADELNDELVAENRDDLSFVWQAVRDLPEKYRAPVHLFYHEGYSTKQIAEILQRGEATVRSDLHRGRALLREILKEAYNFDEIR